MAIQTKNCIAPLEMTHSVLLLFISLVLLLPMFTGCKDWSDIKLTGRTKRIIELYIETEDCTDATIIIYGYSRKDRYTIRIYADEEYPADRQVYGYYYGTTFYKNKRIDVWGNNCNAFFWEAKHKPVYVSKPKCLCEFDPCNWNLTVRKSDSTIVETECSFYCGIDFPIDTFNTLLKQ